MLLPVNLLLFELKCISKETQTLVIERLYEEKHSFPEALKERYHQKIIDKKLPQPPPNPKKKIPECVGFLYLTLWNVSIIKMIIL